MNAIDPTTAESRTERESWVEEIEAECFRGISRALRLSLGTQPGGPTSLLLIGDNGTGKSSVVDALQFALQGEIRGFTGRRAYPIARSGVSDASPPRVAAVLSSGDRFERSFAVDAAGQPQVVGDSAAVAFSRTPLVLRRTDILRFWDTDAAQRQLLLARYFKAEDVPAIDAPWRAPAEIEPPASTRSSLIAEALEGVEARVTGAFARISPQSPVRSVVISLPEPAGLDIKIELASGQLSDPALVLSEANRDVLALLTFVAVAQAAAERGQAKSSSWHFFGATDEPFEATRSSDGA